MIIDKINEALSQRPFALLGLGLLTLLRGETGVIGWFATGLGAAAVLCLVLVLALRAGLIRSLERLLLALSDRLNSPGLNPGRYGERINHYTVLRTIQAMYGLAPLAHSTDQQPMNDIWHYETVPPTADRLPLPGGLLIK